MTHNLNAVRVVAQRAHTAVEVYVQPLGHTLCQCLLNAYTVKSCTLLIASQYHLKAVWYGDVCTVPVSIFVQTQASHLGGAEASINRALLELLPPPRGCRHCYRLVVPCMLLQQLLRWGCIQCGWDRMRC